MIGVRFRGQERVCIPENGNAVLDADHPDFLVERAGVGIFGRHSPMADAASHLAIGAGGVNVLRLAPVLDVADHAAADFRRLDVRPAVDRDNLDRRPRLPHVAGDLAHELRQLVDDEARPALAGFQRQRIPLVFLPTAAEPQILVGFIDVALLARIVAIVLEQRLFVDLFPIGLGLVLVLVVVVISHQAPCHEPPPRAARLRSVGAVSANRFIMKAYRVADSRSSRSFTILPSLRW
jgi:hypothetical protein